MYVIIVGDDNSLYGSQKEKIIQREKLFNKLWFLVKPHYNEIDMSQCVVTMRYLTPISREFKTETLVLSKERYEDYLKYVLPIDTELTKEWGEIELNLTFTMVDVGNDGNIIQRVRKTTNHILNIVQIPDWDSIIPDSALSALDQRIIEQTAQIKALEDLTNKLDSKKVDNLVYNEVEDTLQLSAKGVGVGDKVSVKDILDDGIPVVNLDSDSGSVDTDADKNHHDGCDCGCEDNVVEFGYISNGDVSLEESTDDDNVVEF